METILKKMRKPAFQEFARLLQEANDTVESDFHSKYAEHTIGMGERSVDYIQYYFELSGDYHLFMDFEDFGFTNYSLVYGKHTDAIRRIDTEFKV